MEDPYVCLALAEGFGERPVAALLEPGADPGRLLRDPPRLPPAVLLRLRDPHLGRRAALLRERAAAAGQQVLTPADPGFPAALDRTPLRPLVLFARGGLAALARRPAVTVVGSRTPTPYGREATTAFGEALARAGVVLWSGLARGVDGEVHRCSVAAGGPTVAVLAGGLDRIYPPEHAGLGEAILAAGGCLLSELPPGRRARRGHFPRRNRILAAATPATLVVEAGASSGALHTARHAAECGAAVFAVPGPWASERSRGCHRLLQEGAMVAADPVELLRDLGVQAATPAAAAHALHGSADAQAILEALRAGPRPADLLQRETALPRARFLAARLGLERDGQVRTLPGDLLARRF